MFDADKTVVNAPVSESTQVVSQPSANVTQMATTVECPVCHTTNASTEVYCSDCGFLLNSTPMAVEAAEVQGPTAKFVTSDGRESFLNVGVNTIGRVDADVLVPDPTVSRKHAELSFRDGGWWLVDVGSTNGTFVDNTQLKVNEPVQLVNGSVVKFGTASMTFESTEVQVPPAQAETTTVIQQEVTVAVAPPVEAEAVSPESAEPAEEPEEEVVPVEATEDTLVEPAVAPEEHIEPELVEPETPAIVGKLVNMADPSAGYPLATGENTIGRAPSNSIQILGDPYVSGRHAQINYADDKFVLMDVGSTNGTLLNGQPAPKQEPLDLSPGDEVGIGQGRYKLEV